MYFQEIFFFVDQHFIRFHDDKKVKQGSRICTDGVPFVVLGSRLLECHQGPDHRKFKKEMPNANVCTSFYYLISEK